MGDDKNKWSNVIIGPWEQVKSYKTLNHSRVVRLEIKLFRGDGYYRRSVSNCYGDQSHTNTQRK